MITNEPFDPTVTIPGGAFEMGSSLDEIRRTAREWSGKLLRKHYEPVFADWLMKEYPAHRVEVGSFVMMKYPVTNGAYRAYLGANEAAARPESIETGLPDDHPVWGVSLDMSLDYIRWRSEAEGYDWRLPTEAEWEWAARGGCDDRYPFGDQFEASLCNTREAGRRTTTPVDAHPDGASRFGVLDLAGNVEEWTSSLYRPYPGGKEVRDDLLNLLGTGYPILRGGSFELNGDLARTRRRHGPHPGRPFRVTGFRCVRSAT